MRQTRRSIHFRTQKDLPHPEGEENPEKYGIFISRWELRIWKFRRAVEILIFNEDAEYEEDEDLSQVKIEAAQGNLPDEYYLFLIGAFDIYPLDLPVNWLMAREIIKEVQSVQVNNEKVNRDNQAFVGDGYGSKRN